MILDSLIKPKQFFDINNKQHIKLVQYYVENLSWGDDGCPFVCEYPYLTVPDMIKDQVLHKFFKVPYNRKHHTGL